MALPSRRLLRIVCLLRYAHYTLDIGDSVTLTKPRLDQLYRCLPELLPNAPTVQLPTKHYCVDSIIGSLLHVRRRQLGRPYLCKFPPYRVLAVDISNRSSRRLCSGNYNVILDWATLEHFPGSKLHSKTLSLTIRNA